MKNDIKKLILESVMSNLSSIITEEVESMSNKKELSEKPSYVVDSTYCDDKITKMLDMYEVSVSKMKSGVRVYCISWQDVVKVISVFEQYKALEREALNGKEYGALKIYKWRSSMNDSVSENVNEARSYKENINPKGETPTAHAKRDAMRAVQNGELERDPEKIKEYLLATGLWDNISETRLRLDIKFVMDKTEEWVKPISGDYVTDFTWSATTTGDDRRTLSEEEALLNHIRFLKDNGMTVTIKPKRFSTKIYIHYDNRRQYEQLVKWVMWDLGMVESIHNGGRAGADRREAEEIIASGKSPAIF